MHLAPIRMGVVHECFPTEDGEYKCSQTFCFTSLKKANYQRDTKAETAKAKGPQQMSYGLLCTSLTPSTITI
ncbi:hypothetical protein TSMEX_009693 [Taenia solium]|eukprot:TsM_001210800 transcript=TsM_001210800 gene=TsM_001210800